MKINVESKYDIGDWVFVGSIICRIKSIDYQHGKNSRFSYLMDKSCSKHVTNDQWFEETEIIGKATVSS